MSRIVGSRAPGALLRAGLVALLVALPEILLSSDGGTAQIAALVALVAALFTFSEYAAGAPSVVEFRDARPYNRLLAASLAASLVLASAAMRPDWAETPAARPVILLGEAWARLLDLPWSPVAQLMASLPEGASADLGRATYAAAAAAYGLSLLAVLVFALIVRGRRWPGASAFNLWVNLPQFDPTSGGDVVVRLRQNAMVNVALGLLLPLIVPIVADLFGVAFDGPLLRDPAALVWVVVLWAFVPAALAMRGLALHRLAQLVTAHRARQRRAGGQPRPA